MGPNPFFPQKGCYLHPNMATLSATFLWDVNSRGTWWNYSHSYFNLNNHWVPIKHFPSLHSTQLITLNTDDISIKHTIYKRLLQNFPEIHRAMPVSAIFQCDSSSTHQLNLSWAGGVLVPVLWAIAWMLEVRAIVNEISCDFAFHHVPGFTKLNLKSDFPMQFFSNKIRFVSLVLTTRKICDSQYHSTPQRLWRHGGAC